MTPSPETNEPSIEMTPQITRGISDGILGDRDGDCLSASEIKSKIFNSIEEIDWSGLAALYKEKNTTTIEADHIEKRFRKISMYIISIFDKKKCTQSWKEYITYLNGFVAAVVFANVTTNNKNLFLKNGVTAGGIMTYNAINFYVASLASVKKHFEERYKQLDQLIDDAYINKFIYSNSNDIESQGVAPDDDMIYIIKAIVVSLYSLELELNTQVENLNQRVFANYCLDLFQATFLYVANKSRLLVETSEDSNRELTCIDLAEDLLNQIERKNFNRYPWHTLTQEDGKHSEIMLNAIARHYNGKSKYTHSSKDLFFYSYNREDFRNHSSDLTNSFNDQKEACNNAFEVFVSAIESRKQIEHNLFLLSSAIIISSIAYSMSFNNPFSIGQMWFNVIYSAVAFIAAQKIDEINQEKAEKHQAFVGSIRNVSHSLKTGRFLQKPEDRDSAAPFKPKWLVNASPDGSSVRASRTLQDIHFIAALTFVKLEEKGFNQSKINRMDMATTYMNINIALAKGYEQIGQQRFSFTNTHASAVSSALAILILDNIRGSQNHNCDPAACFRPITGVLLNVPNVSDMYQTIDKAINIHDLQKQNNTPESSMLLGFLSRTLDNSLSSSGSSPFRIIGTNGSRNRIPRTVSRDTSDGSTRSPREVTEINDIIISLPSPASTIGRSL